MDSLTLIGFAVYFTIGWFLSEALNKNDREEVATFTMLFWPVYIIILVAVFVLVILMLIAVFATRLVNGFHDKGDRPDGAV